MTVIPALTALLVAEFGKSSLDFTSIGLRESASSPNCTRSG